MKEMIIESTSGPCWFEKGIIRHYVETKKPNFDEALDFMVVTGSIANSIDCRKLLLIDMGVLRNLTPDAREVFSADSKIEQFDKVALLVDDPVAEVLENCFLGIRKSVIEIKIFVSKDSAIKWLRAG